jgi:chemotaxis protein MotB
MAMQKKAKAPEPAGESAPMWIVSFADLVTLLMSFFVVLYAMKQGGPEQQLETAAAIKATFDPSFMPPADSSSDWDQAIRRAHGMPGPPYDNTGGKIAKTAQGPQGSNAEVQTIREGKDIVTGGKILFDLGDAKLAAGSLDTVKQIADHLKGHNNVLLLKGHVSAEEVALHPDDPNGMTLSYRRATAVANELAKLGIDRQALRPVACGAFEPVKVGAYDRAELQDNRRVEVFTTDDTVSDYFPTRTVSPADSQPHDADTTQPAGTQ